MPRFVIVAMVSAIAICAVQQHGAPAHSSPAAHAYSLSLRGTLNRVIDTEASEVGGCRTSATTDGSNSSFASIHLARISMRLSTLDFAAVRIGPLRGTTTLGSLATRIECADGIRIGDRFGSTTEWTGGSVTLRAAHGRLTISGAGTLPTHRDTCAAGWPPDLPPVTASLDRSSLRLKVVTVRAQRNLQDPLSGRSLLRPTETYVGRDASPPLSLRSKISPHGGLPGRCFDVGSQ